MLLVDLMHQGAVFSADAYYITLEQLRAAMKKKFPLILMKGVLPVCADAWLENSCSVSGGLSWNVQCPDLEPSYYHLSPAIEDHLHKFQSHDDVMTGVAWWLQLQDTTSVNGE